MFFCKLAHLCITLCFETRVKLLRNGVDGVTWQKSSACIPTSVFPPLDANDSMTKSQQEWGMRSVRIPSSGSIVNIITYFSLDPENYDPYVRTNNSLRLLWDSSEQSSPTLALFVTRQTVSCVGNWESIGWKGTGDDPQGKTGQEIVFLTNDFPA